MYRHYFSVLMYKDSVVSCLYATKLGCYPSEKVPLAGKKKKVRPCK